MNRAVFFSRVRKAFGPLNQQQVTALDNLLTWIEEDPHLVDVREPAYMLATTKHETNSTYLPVIEAYWMSESWRSQNLRYYPWYGRGFVQLTWEKNYARAGSELGIDLLRNKELALDPAVAYKIMSAGMRKGWFTGKRMSQYFGTKTDYHNARRIINGLDRAATVAGYAQVFEEALRAAGWLPKGQAVA